MGDEDDEGIKVSIPVKEGGPVGVPGDSCVGGRRLGRIEGIADEEGGVESVGVLDIEDKKIDGT